MRLRILSLVTLVTFAFLVFSPGALAAPPDGINPKVFKVGRIDVTSYLPNDVPMPAVQAFVEDKTGKRTLAARVTHWLLDKAVVDGENVARGETLIVTGFKETDVGTLDDNVPLPGAGEDSDVYSVMYQYQRVEWLYKTKDGYRKFYQIQKNDAYWKRSRTNLTIPSNGAKFTTQVIGARWSDESSYYKRDEQYKTPSWKTSYETYHSYTTSPHKSWEYCFPLPPQDNLSLVSTKIYGASGQVGMILTGIQWAS